MSRAVTSALLIFALFSGSATAGIIDVTFSGTRLPTSFGEIPEGIFRQNSISGTLSYDLLDATYTLNDPSFKLWHFDDLYPISISGGGYSWDSYGEHIFVSSLSGFAEGFGQGISGSGPGLMWSIQIEGTGNAFPSPIDEPGQPYPGEITAQMLFVSYFDKGATVWSAIYDLETVEFADRAPIDVAAVPEPSAASFVGGIIFLGLLTCRRETLSRLIAKATVRK